VGSPVERWRSIVLRTSHPLGVICLNPQAVFGVVVTAGYETLPKGVVVGVELLQCDDWFGWEIDCRNY
jgi:hypothetical protein